MNQQSSSGLFSQKNKPKPGKVLQEMDEFVETHDNVDSLNTSTETPNIHDTFSLPELSDEQLNALFADDSLDSADLLNGGSCSCKTPVSKPGATLSG